jgi:hypothetical protein
MDVLLIAIAFLFGLAGHVINVFTQQRPDLAKKWRTVLDSD